MKKFLSLFVALAMVLSLFAGVGARTAKAATNWYVDPAGTDDATHGTYTLAAAFKTIQYAVNAATAGDTIYVGAGTYNTATGVNTFPINVTKALTIRSLAGAAATTIDPEHLTHASFAAFNVTAANVTISGFTIIAGGRSGIYADVTGGSGITVKDCIFSSYSANQSRGMWFEKLWNSALIDGNSFANGGSDKILGTGIMVVNADGATISDNTVASGMLHYSFLTFKAEAFYPLVETGAPYTEHAAATASTINNVVVTGNSIFELNRPEAAIHFATSVHIDVLGLDTGLAYVQSLSVGTGGVDISDNTFDGTGTYVRIDATTAGDPIGDLPSLNSYVTGVDHITINTNEFLGTLAGSRYAVDNGSAVNYVDATSNWWDTADLAAVTAKTSGLVTYKPYWITVDMEDLSDIKAITAFSFASPAAVGVITGTNIAVTVPNSTTVAQLAVLVPTIIITGASVSPASGAAQNFNSPVTYRVTAVDATFVDYIVTVTVASESTKAITAFNFGTVVGVVNETAKTIALTVPHGTDVTTLVATFATTGASVKVGTVVQTSGTTPNTFASPVTYRVTAVDLTFVDYVVTVTVAADTTTKDITAFSFASPAAIGVISGANIAVTVPYGTTVTALVATFTTTGASVKVGTVVQTSGTTPNTFASPLAYIVTDADANTKTYTVTVTVAAITGKDITSFKFNGLTPAVVGGISGTAVTLHVPFGTVVTALVPTITITGASVSPASGVAQNFTSPVAYTVSSAETTPTTQTYVVTVIVDTNAAKAITAFSFNGLTPAVVGVVNETLHTVLLTVPYGTTVTALVATFTTTGASVKVSTTLQVSGTTAHDFTNPVTYRVTAVDASIQDYTVTVAFGPNPTTLKAITAFNFYALSPNVIGVVNETLHTVALTVPYGTVVTALVPTITMTGASVSPASGVAHDFTTPVTYTVTASDSTTQAYIVTVTVAPSTTGGDVNGDGITNVLDVLVTANAAASIGTPLTGAAFLAADANHDGIINVLDVLLIAQIAAH